MVRGAEGSRWGGRVATRQSESRELHVQTQRGCGLGSQLAEKALLIDKLWVIFFLIFEKIGGSTWFRHENMGT